MKHLFEFIAKIWLWDRETKLCKRYKSVFLGGTVTCVVRERKEIISSSSE
jgi:hypothetical protein